MQKHILKEYSILAVMIAVLLGLSWLVAMAAPVGEWYAELDKPPLTPPNIAFPIVWPILYMMIGSSLWLTWRAEPSAARSSALKAHAVQLAVNYPWMLLFFNAHWLIVSNLWIVTLLALIGWTIRCCYKVSNIASWLLIPYLLWIGFASYLTISIALLN